MTDCEKIQEMISAMLDGELSEKEKRAIEEHIADCPECAAMYADFAALSTELTESFAEVPATLHDRIMKGVRTSPKPGKPLLITLRPYMSAAACLVVIIGAVFAIRDSGIIGWDNTEDSTAAYDMPASAPAAAADSAAFDTYGFEYAESQVVETEEGAEAEEVKSTSSQYNAADEPAAAEPESPAEMPAEEPDEAPEEAIEEEIGVFNRNMSLTGYEDYIPGTAIDEAWFIHYSGDLKNPQMQRILFPEILCEVLADAPAEIALEAIPEEPDALLNLRIGNIHTTLKLYFHDGSLIVETSGGFYMAVGSPEEFLSINDWTIS